MSDEAQSASSPPQYIITTPSEVDTEEERSVLEFEANNDVGRGGGFAQAHQTVASQMSATQTSSRSFTISSSSSCHVASTSATVQTQQQQDQQHQDQQHRQWQQQQIVTQTHSSVQKTMASSLRSQSLQSSANINEPPLMAANLGASLSGTSGNGGGTSGNSSVVTLGTAHLAQQLKAQSSTSIVSSEHRMQKTSSTSSAFKSKFHSFLQNPDAAAPHHLSSSAVGGGGGGGGGGFLTAHQKHVRQFVRSTSAHSDATASTSGSMRADKCTRSSSTQIEDSADGVAGSSDAFPSISATKLGLHQSSSILISKSAEAIETRSSSSSGIRTQLTLSGGLLAPPNRKITILSPIHAPPGLHDMLKRSGRSPLSPRISFPGTEADLFG